MTATKTMTPTCSHCGEPRADGQEHDGKRCFVIAHAIAAVRGWTPEPATEADRNIVALRDWLNAHSATPAGTDAQRSRADRASALDRWVRIAAE